MLALLFFGYFMSRLQPVKYNRLWINQQGEKQNLGENGQKSGFKFYCKSMG
jgi:hypothetical protein